MRINDVILGPIIAVLGLALCIWSLMLHSPSHLNYGPGLFPRLTGAGLILTGLAIGAGALLRGDTRGHRARAAWLSDRRIAVRFGVILIAPFFYMTTAGTLGFLATATLILIAIMLSNEIRVRSALPVSLVLAAVVNLIFASFLGVPLPWGPLTPISGYLIW